MYSNIQNKQEVTDFAVAWLIIPTNMVYRWIYFAAPKAVGDAALVGWLIHPDATFIPLYLISLLRLAEYRERLFVGCAVPSLLPLISLLFAPFLPYFGYDKMDPYSLHFQHLTDSFLTIGFTRGPLQVSIYSEGAAREWSTVVIVIVIFIS